MCGTLLVSCFTLACAGEPDVALAADPGEPLPGLDSTLLARFAEGRALFDRDFDESQGLGPSFNQTRCSSCHDVPVIGGGGVEFARKATRLESDGRCNQLEAFGGPMFQDRVTEAARGQGVLPEAIPAEATHSATLNPPALFGGGLIQSIPEEDLLANEDPDDLDGDGISGRAVRRTDGAVGRFGLKASHATLESFVTEALLMEMGLTAPGIDEDLPIGNRHVGDEVNDPEVTDLQVSRLVDFVSFLAPLAAAVQGDAGEHASGAALFSEIGCAGCHTPFQTAGRQAPGDAPGRTFPLYSDLLLHDLGAEVAGHCTPAASVSEWRTAPLAGLRYRTALFHDGLVENLERAIARHGGEAAAVQSRYHALSAEDRRRLLSFLSTL